MKFIALLLVEFYKFWHGSLGLKGAGFLLRKSSLIISPLRNYPLKVPYIGKISIDFSDCSGFAWLNQVLGEGGQEDGIISFLKESIKNINKPVCIWDVGANGGYFASAILASVQNVERLNLFEPNPLHHHILQSIAAQNDVVQFHGVGLSEKVGVITMSHPLGDSSLATSDGKKYSAKFEGAMTTGDNVVSYNPSISPDIIIIDVEGFECEVLAGMKDILSRLHPVVIVEHIFVHPEKLDRFFSAEYKRFTIDDSTGTLVDSYNLLVGHNSVYLPLNYQAVH
jgi:FkbM family methyltransferase